MKALKEIGIKKTIRFVGETFLLLIFKLMIFPNLRVLFLRLLGSQIGKNVVIHNIHLFNLYRGSFRNLIIKDNVFIGPEVMLDLADKIVLEKNVTLAQRVLILTHMNVGYLEHYLQRFFPSMQKPVLIENDTFIGAGTIILAGVRVGKCSLIAAGSLVNKDIPPYSVAAGIPAKIIKQITPEA